MNGFVHRNHCCVRSKGSEGGRETFSKAWKEWFFLTEPESFVLTHMPLDDDTIQPDEQHMENPITDAKQWAEMALMSPQAVQYGIKPLTHPKNLIETSTGEVIIQYTCGFPFNQYIKVAKISKNGTKRKVNKSDSLDSMVALFTSSNPCTIMTRFTEPGTYEIELWAKIDNGHAALKTVQKLLHYSITNTLTIDGLPETRLSKDSVPQLARSL